MIVVIIITGHYPFPPETYSNVFAQLQAIVHGDPPSLPSQYSAEADDFVNKCLRKDPYRRPSYAQLMVGGYARVVHAVSDAAIQEHPFLVADRTREVDMAAWVAAALEFKASTSGSPSTPSSASGSATPSPITPAP